MVGRNDIYKELLNIKSGISGLPDIEELGVDDYSKSAFEKVQDIKKENEWSENLELSRTNDPANAAGGVGRVAFITDMVQRYVDSFRSGSEMSDDEKKRLGNLLNKESGLLWGKLGIDLEDRSFTKKVGNKTYIDKDKIKSMAKKWKTSMKDVRDQHDILSQWDPESAANLKEMANLTGRSFSQYKKVKPSSAWRTKYHYIEKAKEKGKIGAHEKGAFDANLFDGEGFANIRKQTEMAGVKGDTLRGVQSAYHKSIINMIDHKSKRKGPDGEPLETYLINEAVEYQKINPTTKRSVAPTGLNHLHGTLKKASVARERLYHAIRLGESGMVYSLGGPSQEKYLKRLPIGDFPILKHIYDNKASEEQQARIQDTIRNLPTKWGNRKKQLMALLNLSPPAPSTEDKSPSSEIENKVLLSSDKDAPTKKNFERVSKEEDERIRRDLERTASEIKRINEMDKI